MKCVFVSLSLCVCRATWSLSLSFERPAHTSTRAHTSIGARFISAQECEHWNVNKVSAKWWWKCSWSVDGCCCSSQSPRLFHFPSFFLSFFWSDVAVYLLDSSFGRCSDLDGALSVTFTLKKFGGQTKWCGFFRWTCFLLSPWVSLFVGCFCSSVFLFLRFYSSARNSTS